MWRGKLKKNIIYSTLFLIILSSISKILSFIVRIYLARKLPQEALSDYSIVMPTLVFLISLAQMGIPPALSKILAETKNQLNGILTAFILSFMNNILIITIFICLIPFLSNHLFHDLAFSRILRSMIFMIHMVTLSGLLKAILQGNQHHYIASSSQIFEEVFRIIYLIIRFNYPVDSIMEYASSAMFSIFIGEIGSTLYMLCFLFFNKNIFKRRQHDIKLNMFTDILSLSLPMSASRLIGSFTYFLEPIIFLSYYNHLHMENIYGIFNGYVLPIITISSFVGMTLSSVLLPTFVYQKTHYHIKKAVHTFISMSLICLFISSICSLLTFLFPNQILNLFYHTDQGANILKIFSLPFIFYSLQPVFSSILHALNLSKKAMFDTILGCILRLLLLLLTPFLNEFALYLAIIISMLTTTLLHAYHIFHSLKPNFS